MGAFARTNAGMDQLGFVRGPAMIYAAPMTQAAPTSIADILRLSGTETNEVQTLSIAGTPTGGSFKLTFRGSQTAAINYNATAANVQAALEALSVVSAGNVVCAGGPLPGTPVTITFQNALGAANQPTIQVTTPAFTGGSTPAGSVAETTPGAGMFDPLGSWYTLGATKNGIAPSYNNTEEEFTIDQQTVAIGTLPNSSEWTLATSLVEVTPENLAFAWDMGGVTLNATPAVPEKKMGFGAPKSYTHRRIAVIHRRSFGSQLLRAHFFYDMTRAPQESTLTYAPTGDQQSIPFSMRAFVNQQVADEYSNVGYLMDQQG